MIDPAEHGLVVPERRPEIPGAPLRVSEAVSRVAAEDPDREALVGERVRLSYAALDAGARRACVALAVLGVEPGDRVAVALGNHPEIVVAFLGAMRLGAIVVGIHRALAPWEKELRLADCRARVLLADEPTVAEIEAMRGELPALEQVLRADPEDAASPWARRMAQADPARAPEPAADPFAPAAIAYTRGVHGPPKGAVHSQHNLLLPAVAAAATGLYPAGLRNGAALPLTSLATFVLGPLLAFELGGTCVLFEDGSTTAIAARVREERVARLAAAPGFFHDLATDPDVKPGDLATLSRPEAVGAPVWPRLHRIYRDRFGVSVTAGYGLTEAPATVARTSPEDPFEPLCCGRPLPHVSIDVRDAADRPADVGARGEICVLPATRGRFAGAYTPFLGYWERPDATAAALRGGCLHTGDVGWLDHSGRLFSEGPRAAQIPRGGAVVSPVRIEAALLDDERVAAAAVVGVGDPRLGRRVVAFVQPERGAKITHEELETLCATRLANYEIPDEFVLVGSFPRDALGRIRKRDLRRLVEEGALGR